MTCLRQFSILGAGRGRWHEVGGWSPMMEGWLETGTLAKELSLLAWAPGLIGDFDRRTYARPVVSVAVSYP